MAVARLASVSELSGLKQLVQILTGEGLIRVGEDGRVEPALAEGWDLSADSLVMNVRLRSSATFHDGSPVTADAVVTILNSVLPQFMGPAFEDVDRVTSRGANRIEIGFRKRSPFLLEALEAQIRKPQGPRAGTGPFQPVEPNSLNDLRANQDYYQGRPNIDRITVTNYPSVRAAWAELLRGRIDMLHEVSSDALDSLQSAQDVTVFRFTQHYQYALIFNSTSPALRPREVRQALDVGVDRRALVRDALNGYGLPSSGPVWPQHWAFDPAFRADRFNPRAAVAKLGDRRVHFTCLVFPDFERIALVLKRQLEAVGVDMLVKEGPVDEILDAVKKHNFDAVLIDPISGPSLFRVYEFWHAGGSVSIGQPSRPHIDAELDRIRHAGSDEEYRRAVSSFQQTVVDDPPAIFLAWSERARAVSNRFNVPLEPGRDVLTTLRLWRPVVDQRTASRN